MPFLVANAFLALARETTRGTAATAGWQYVPIDSPALTPNLKWLDDDGLRGSPVKQYDTVPGVRSDTFEFKGKVHTDNVGALLLAALGGPDTVTGTAAPYTHTIGLLNNQTGSQPPSYTLQVFDGWQTRQITGAQMVSLEVTFTAEAEVAFTAKFEGNPYTVITTPTNTPGTTDHLIAAWNTAVTIGGSASTTFVDGSLMINRSAAPIFTAGTQGPYTVWAAEAEVTGKLTVVAEASDTVLTGGLARGQGLVKFVSTDPVSTHALTLQCSDAQIHASKPETSKSYVEVSAEFLAVANTTDATNGGYSPVKAIVLNAVSTAY